MRYSRMSEDKKRKPSGGKGGILIAAIIAIGAAVYFIGAAKVGAFLSDKVITPVVLWVTGETAEKEARPISAEGEENTGDSIEESENGLSKGTVSFLGKTAYMLQIGVFDQRENAEKLAEEMKAKGCAGYIYEDGGSYRVFISAYPDKEDAESVKNRIMDEYDMDTKLYEFSVKGVSIDVCTEKEVLERIEAAAKETEAHAQTALDISQGFDRGNINAEDASLAIRALLSEADGKKAEFFGYADRTDNALIEAGADYYSDVYEVLSVSLEKMTEAEISSALKNAYIELLFCYKTLLERAL